MPSPVYSTNFVSVEGQLSTPFIYTVPLDKVAVMKSVDIFFNSANPDIVVYIRDNITNGAFISAANTLDTVGAPKSFAWYGSQVFGPGTSFNCSCNDALGIGANVRISGYLLDYP